jgi:hypothetical protein
VSGHATLFNSDFRHQHYITIRIKRASLRRDLSNDWIFGGQELIEVALSEAQWATFISTLNHGDGVPCTLNWLPDGLVPGIEPDLDRRAQFRGEVSEHIVDALASIDEVLASPGLRKKDKEALERAKRQMQGNLNFIVEQFDEHAEKTLEKAKIEVEAYLTGAVQRAGLKALGAEPPVLELAEPLASD